MEDYKVFSQACPPPAQSEKVDKKDLGVLDTVSITSVVDFIKKFASDATFAPPTVATEYDSDNFDLNIDDSESFPELFQEVEDLEDVRARD